MPDRWTERFSLDRFPLMSGPASMRSPPAIAPGDRVLFHAVGHARIFAAAVVTGEPVFDATSRWAPRWPWTYPCRVDAWVPRITDGPRSTPTLPRRAMGHIQRGGQYARLSEDEFLVCLQGLLAGQGARRRRGGRS